MHTCPHSADAGAADRAVSYIAAYLSLYGLLMWAGVYPYLQGAQRERELSEMLPQAQAARDDSEAPTEKAEDAAGEGARSPATPTRCCACYGVLKRFLKRFASPVPLPIRLPLHMCAHVSSPNARLEPPDAIFF